MRSYGSASREKLPPLLAEPGRTRQTVESEGPFSVEPSGGSGGSDGSSPGGSISKSTYRSLTRRSFPSSMPLAWQSSRTSSVFPTKVSNENRYPRLHASSNSRSRSTTTMPRPPARVSDSSSDCGIPRNLADRPDRDATGIWRSPPGVLRAELARSHLRLARRGELERMEAELQAEVNRPLSPRSSTRYGLTPGPRRRSPRVVVRVLPPRTSPSPRTLWRAWGSGVTRQSSW
jgi:hypothetical protein